MQALIWYCIGRYFSEHRVLLLTFCLPVKNFVQAKYAGWGGIKGLFFQNYFSMPLSLRANSLLFYSETVGLSHGMLKQILHVQVGIYSVKLMNLTCLIGYEYGNVVASLVATNHFVLTFVVVLYYYISLDERTTKEMLFL